MNDRGGRLEILLQRQEILDCLTRFSRGMELRNVCVMENRGDFVGGPADLYAWASAMHEQGQIATNHNLLNHTCDIAGDTAHTETYYLFVGRNRDDTNWIAGGRYLDRVERREGAWRTRCAPTAIEWSGQVPTMPIPYADVPGVHLNGTPSRSRRTRPTSDR